MRDTPEKPVGVASGRWFTFGDGDDLPGDQRPDDALSVCFDGAPTTVETASSARPAGRRSRVDGSGSTRSDTHSGVGSLVSAQFPRRILPQDHVRRVQRLRSAVLHRNPVLRVQPPRRRAEDESAFAVTVACDYCAFSSRRLELRVALSQTYWPVIAPSPAGFEPLAIVGGACEIPALSDEHIADSGVILGRHDPRARNSRRPARHAPTARRRGSRNDRIGAGASTKAIRRADGGARLVQIKDSRLVVESQAVDISAKSARSQRIERRRVIKGLATSGKASPKSALDSMHAFGPASPHTSRSSTPGLVDAEIVVGAEMTVVDGAYKFDTKLEAFVTEENEDSDTEKQTIGVRALVDRDCAWPVVRSLAKKKAVRKFAEACQTLRVGPRDESISARAEKVSAGAGR